MKRVLLLTSFTILFALNLNAQWDKYPIVNNEFKDTEIPKWADLNGDDQADLIGYDKDSQSLFWRENNGTNMEEPKVILDSNPIKEGNYQVLDWEDDGDIDIVAHLEKGIGNDVVFLLLLNNGNGTFVDSEIEVASNQFIPDFILFSDLNHDASKDLVLQKNGDYYIYLNNAGVYTFNSQIDGSLRSQIYSQDLNQNGENQIVVAKDDFAIEVYDLSSSVLSLQQTIPTSYPGDDNTSIMDPLEFRDIDNDGDIDITRNIQDLEIQIIMDVGQVIPKKNYFYQYTQNPDGSFDSFRFYTSILDGTISYVLSKDKSDNSFSYYIYDDALKIFSFNNGKFELTETNNETIPQNLVGVLGAHCVFPTQGEQIYSIIRTGLFYEVGIANISLVPEEVFAWQGCLNCSPIEFYDDFEFADLDGDGDLDIIVSSVKNDNQVLWFENFREGCHFDNINSIPGVFFDEETEILTVESADFDNDGDMDIVIMANVDNADLYILKNDGAGNFSAPVYLTSLEHAIDLHAEDLYNDGYAEIIVHTGEFSFITQDSTTYSTTILGNQNGIENFTSTRIQNSTDAGQIVFADMDNDGDLDMIVYNEDSLFDNIVIYDNDGTQMVQSQIHEDFIDMFAMDVFDYNQDNFPDIIAYHDGLSSNNISTAYNYNNNQGIVDWTSPTFLFESIDRFRHYGIHNQDNTIGFVGATGIGSVSNLTYYNQSGIADTLDIFTPLLYKTADLNNDGFDDIINANDRGALDFYTRGSINCDPPCVPDTDGYLFFQDCDGVEFFVIETAEGELLDPYFADGVQFVYYDGMYIRFSFTDLGIATPCEGARTVEIQCIEEVLHIPEFTDYDWLPALIDDADGCCEIEKIESFYNINTRYIYVTPRSDCPQFRETLYAEDNVILCVEPDVFAGQCIANFGLDTLTRKLIWECDPVSNEDTFLENDIKLYPNPVSDLLTIETNFQGKLKIYNAQGKCLKSYQDIPTSINLIGFNDGVYILSFGHKDHVVTKRVVKM